MPEFFAKDKIIGVFKGFAERGIEFAAELVWPYRRDLMDDPQLGRFLLVQLSNEEEAALVRVTKFVPGGMLALPEGEEYFLRTQERDMGDVKEDIKKAHLKYRVQVKLLGVVRVQNDKIVYTPSHRRIPHLGAKVAWPGDEVSQMICELGGGETDLGDFALGEFVYNGGKEIGDPFVPMSPTLRVNFNVNNLVARRTAVFARAGYGKSNLMKHLIAELYRDGVPKYKNKRPAGVLIFDADGEYSWPDTLEGRPGLCDVPHLREHIRVFTKKPKRADYYDNYTAGGVKLDLRRFKPRDVMEIALTPDRQEQQNVNKIKGARKNWAALVDLIYEDRTGADEVQIGKLLGYKTSAQINQAAAEIGAARNNLNRVVESMHDPDSKTSDDVIAFLREGKVVVVDISLLSARGGEIIAGLLLRKIFSYNQEKFTDPSASPLPVITVIEEAQSVLGGKLAETSPFVEWVKEGRKYGLGAILITQQPGSLAPELLSQTDNWFCFHLLAEHDAETLRRFNSHYSPDILAHLVGEPIIGNCYMWSAPRQPFVLPVRVRDFGEQYKDYVGKPGKNTPSKGAGDERQKARDESDRALASKLKAAIKKEHNEQKLGITDFDDGKLRGVKEGKLYHLIKSIKDSDEHRTENDLRDILFGQIFRDVQFQEKNGARYYCAPATAWGKLLK